MKSRDEILRKLNPVVTIDEHTYIYGVWAGPAEGGSVMVTLYRTGDGSLMARGCLRVHRDDKLFASADEKHAFELRAKKGAKVELFKRRVASKLRTMIRGLAVDRDDARVCVKALKWIAVHGDSRALIKALERAALKDGSLNVGVQWLGEVGPPA